MAKLKEVASILCNNRISTKDTNKNEGIHFAHPQHLNPNGTVAWDKCLKIEEDNPLIKATVEKGDILVVVLGGRCGQIFKYAESQPFVTGQTSAIIKTNLSDLYDRLINKQNEINGLIQGVAAKSIPMKYLHELDV